MVQNIGDALKLPEGKVNVKATTEEGLGFTGKEEGISSQAIVLLTSMGDYCFDDRIMAPDCKGCCGGCKK